MQDPDETLNNAADAAGDKAEGAADAVGDAAQGAADAVGDTADAAADLGSQAVAATGEVAEDSGEQVDAGAAAVAAAGAAAVAGAGDSVTEAQATVDQAVATATSGADAPLTSSSAQPPATASTGDMTMPQHRPAGISILGSLAVLWGLLNLFIAPLAAFGNTLFGGGLSAGLWTGAVGVVAGIVWLAIGFAFFRLKPWVWLLSLIVAGISVLQVFVGMLTDPTGIVCGLFGLIVPGLFLWYLTRPHVKAAFGR